ncbi:MAG: ATP-binding cassette domain-containing protein [Eubacteriales bacterium]|nr:ATP-binding cassette domain-containing protein [Eubacteriales bacterium]
MAETKIDYQHTQPLVQAQGVSKWFPVKRGIIEAIQRRPKRYVKAVDDVTLTVYRGECLGLVGESGCGKSTLARTIIRLYDPTKGKIIIDGTDITRLNGKALRTVRPKMQMIFQDPYSSLNPRMSVKEILGEILRVHKMVPSNKVEERIYELMAMCGLSADYASRFPGEFSGGQQQRVGIARALALQPEFIIADEPVSALDVSIQAQIINLLGDLQQQLGLTLLFISHDLRVVRYITHRVAVMYLGSVMELGPSEDVFTHPYHPYTSVLTKAAPVLNPLNRTREYAIEGETPSPINMPSGCRFHPRCTHCKEKCKQEAPELRELAPGRFVACHYPLEAEE